MPDRVSLNDALDEVTLYETRHLRRARFWGAVNKSLALVIPIYLLMCWGVFVLGDRNSSVYWQALFALMVMGGIVGIPWWLILGPTKFGDSSCYWHTKQAKLCRQMYYSFLCGALDLKEYPRVKKDIEI